MKGFVQMPQERGQQEKARAAAAKRKEAARARRLALSMSEQNQAQLLEYATKLETEANELERSQTAATNKKGGE